MLRKAFLLSLMFLISASFAASKEYQIPSANLNYKLNPDGTIDVHQEITYRFSSGTFSELYIRLPPDLQIAEPTGHCTEKQCSFRTQMNEGWRELVLSSSFSAGQRETAVFEYKLRDNVLAQRDSAQFFFKLWGDQWQKQVGTLTAVVEFPGDASKITYFTHPYDILYEVRTQSNSITIVSPNHPAETYLEVNFLMPKEWFSGLPNAKNFMTSQEIIEGEKSGIEFEKKMEEIGLILGFTVLLLVPLALLVCYGLFGGEVPLVKLGYQAIYEHEPPGTLSPTAAAKLIGRGNNGDYIAAEILNLVQNKFIALEQATAKGGFLGLGKETIVVMRLLKKDEEASSLEPHQKEVFSFLWRLADNGTVTSKRFAEVSKQTSYLLEFSRLEKSLYNSFDRRRYLNMKGNYAIYTVSILAIIASFFLMMVFSATAAVFLFFLSIAEAFAAIIIVSARPTIFGRWNNEGRVLEAKWQNFYKFLTDTTLMRDKAPADIILWEKYLVYSTAFGVSGRVTEAVRAKFPGGRQLNSSPMYSNVILASALHSSTRSMSTSFHSMSSGRSGGGFGSGGGGGGGGGGAR
ncbi:MAG: DUF2207 domain-containing protein [Candidatus Micrarchaeota archaeon]